MGDDWATGAILKSERRNAKKRQAGRNPLGVYFYRYGEGGNRTHDTTIFSRVLYQLSYLAWDGAGGAPRRREG